jgi:uncharacterized protein (TIGR03083 family)
VIIVEREGVLAALYEEWDSLLALADELGPDDWGRPTACPGWTVKDTYSHVVGTESMLAGRDNPDVDVSGAAHVRNDIGRFNEVWVEHYRSRPAAEVVADLRAILAERRAALDGMDQAAFDAEGFTPAGPDSYGRFMRIRVMDCWVHEQDVREAVGRPGHLDGLAPQAALAESVRAMGYVVGKKAGAPAGSSVRLELTGPLSGRIDVEVGDRARVVEDLTGEPTATVTLPGDRFMRLAGGRVADPATFRDGVDIRGDTTLGDAVVTNLAYMI